MIIPKRQALKGRRNDPLHLMMTAIGVDLSGATMRFAVKQDQDNVKPADQAAPLLALTMTATPGAQGVRLVDVNTGSDGIAVSRFEIVALKAAMQALPNAAESSADLRLYYDFDWLRAPDDSGWSMLEQTVMYGPLILEGSAND